MLAAITIPPFLVAVVLQMTSWMCLNCKAGKLSGYQNEKINLHLCTVSLTILINLQFFCGPLGCFRSQFVRGGLTEATTFPEGFFFRKKPRNARGMPIECLHRFDAVAQNNLEALWWNQESLLQSVLVVHFLLLFSNTESSPALTSSVHYNPDVWINMQQYLF